MPIKPSTGAQTQEIFSCDKAHDHVPVQISPDKAKKLERKIMNMSVYISINICSGCSNDHLIEMVLLSTHNICFG